MVVCSCFGIGKMASLKLTTPSGKLLWWQVVFGIIGLCLYFKVWKFWGVKERINLTISMRKSIGIIHKDEKLTKAKAVGFGYFVITGRIFNLLRYR